MVKVRSSQKQQMGEASPNTNVIEPCANNVHWIEFQLFDMDNNPVPGEQYKIVMPDESIRTGMLDREGKVRVEGIIAGQARITFPGIDGNEWHPL